jgi:hypothetical protein
MISAVAGQNDASEKRGVRTEPDHIIGPSWRATQPAARSMSRYLFTFRRLRHIYGSSRGVMVNGR